MIEIEKPQIECIETPGDASYGKYVIEPLERGYGTTLGNALRRIMLSSLPGTAATSIKIAGVQHEFSTIPGVKEDVTEIVLNVKSLLTKLHCEGTKTVYIEAVGPCTVTAGDIKADGEVEINGRRVPYRLNAPTQFDIAGHSICIPKGSPFRQRLVNLSHEIGDTIIIIEDEDYSSEQLVMLTALGKIPMAVVSHATASALGRSYPLLDYSVPVSLNQFQSWALAPRDSVLRDSISAWLSH